ncbi:hypothetical protein SELMODRAFT_412702 [Selaginella moellendorffii]|uniref:Uncharacterized protein n=1 Tax=Selaginella moellendorffii TaxID=88036 RepID=D8RL78_SELML|nr:hypothetical protein SELMODRAFT_412702 [Selaginella moellendorffii]
MKLTTSLRGVKTKCSKVLFTVILTAGRTSACHWLPLNGFRIQPTFAIAWSNLAGLLMEAGDYERALAYYQEAIRLKPNFANAHLNLGNALKNLGKAQESYLRAIQLRPDYAIAYGTRYFPSFLNASWSSLSVESDCDPWQ